MYQQLIELEAEEVIGAELLSGKPTGMERERTSTGDAGWRDHCEDPEIATR